MTDNNTTMNHDRSANIIPCSSNSMEADSIRKSLRTIDVEIPEIMLPDKQVDLKNGRLSPVINTLHSETIGIL